MKTWYLVPRSSPWKKGLGYKATPHLASYQGPLFCREGLDMRCLTYQVFMVRLAHVHAVVTRLHTRGFGDEANFTGVKCLNVCTRMMQSGWSRVMHQPKHCSTESVIASSKYATWKHAVPDKCSRNLVIVTFNHANVLKLMYRSFGSCTSIKNTVVWRLVCFIICLLDV